MSLGDGQNAIRCQAVDGRASNASTVWRQVATATGGYACRSHPLPSGGGALVTLPPSGDRWLRRQVATATGG
jgi:hypothetical protein